MFSDTKGTYIDAFSVLSLVMSNDGEGASTLLPVAVIDHGTWLPFGNTSYYEVIILWKHCVLFKTIRIVYLQLVPP